MKWLIECVLVTVSLFCTQPSVQATIFQRMTDAETESVTLNSTALLDVLAQKSPIDLNVEEKSSSNETDLMSPPEPDYIEFLNDIYGNSTDSDLAVGVLYDIPQRAKREAPIGQNEDTAVAENEEKSSAEEENVEKGKVKEEIEKNKRSDDESKSEPDEKMKKMNEQKKKSEKTKRYSYKSSQNDDRKQKRRGSKNRKSRQAFSRSARNAKHVVYRDNEDEDVEEEKENEDELENLMRERKYRARQARSDEDTRSRRGKTYRGNYRKRRFQNADPNSGPNYREVDEEDELNRRRRYYAGHNPFDTSEMDSSRRAYREDGLDEGYRQKHRRQSDYKFRSRKRRFDDDDDDDDSRLDQDEELLRRAREAYDDVRNIMELRQAYASDEEDQRKARTADEDAVYNAQRKRQVQRSPDSHDIRKYEDRWRRQLDDDDSDMVYLGGKKVRDVDEDDTGEEYLGSRLRKRFSANSNDEEGEEEEAEDEEEEELLKLRGKRLIEKDDFHPDVSLGRRAYNVNKRKKRSIVKK